MLHMSLIQQVAQLSVPRSRCDLLTISSISSSTSPGRAANCSPVCGAVLLRFSGSGVRYAPPYSTGFQLPELNDSKLVWLPHDGARWSSERALSRERIVEAVVFELLESLRGKLSAVGGGVPGTFPEEVCRPGYIGYEENGLRGLSGASLFWPSSDMEYRSGGMFRPVVCIGWIATVGGIVRDFPDLSIMFFCDES